MTRLQLSTILAAGVASIAFGTGATAEDGYYVSGSVGATFAMDSSNSGSFDTDFTTGEGGANAVLPAGTSVGWDTEFDNGLFVSGAAGYKMGAWRYEAEVSHSNNDVDTHSGVTAGGGAIGAADASILVSGAQNLGVTVADLVADGQGSVTNTALFANVYRDFAYDGSAFGAYLGAGVGISNVEIDYSPSATTIIDDSETVLGFQLMAGSTYAVNDTTTVYAGYRYRQTSDVEVDVSLFPATLEIENSANIVEVGLRFRF
jgi:opacity protein-like surface antigen